MGNKLTDNGGLGEVFSSLWRNLDEIERGVVPYLVYAIPPVSLDDLIGLSGVSAVKILRVTEELRGKRFLSERKDAGKGLYFFDNTILRRLVEPYMSPQEMQDAARRVVNFYGQSLNAKKEQNILLAELYRESRNIGEGLFTIKEAADVLLRSGQKERAITYYDEVIRYFAEKEPASVNAVIYLDALLSPGWVQACILCQSTSRRYC